MKNLTRSEPDEALATASDSGRRGARSDGQEARQRLLLAALALFADRGFARTSTREIAQAASANIAAISYYFGGKPGLYAACFSEPLGADEIDLKTQCEGPGMPAHEALHRFLSGYIAPLKQGDVVRQCMRLHMREMVDPTGLPGQDVERDIKAPHQTLIGILSRHLGVAADEDLHRLAFAITGLALQLYVRYDFISEFKPSLLRGKASVDRWGDELTRYACALLDAEASRRAQAEPRAAARPPKRKPRK